MTADDYDDLAARAAAARTGDRVPDAINLYKRALDLNPKWEEGWWFLGSLLYDTDQYPGSRDAFQHLVVLNAKAVPGWAFLGLCEFETHDYSKALEDILHAVSLGADKDQRLAPILLYHEALLRTREGDFDRALQRLAVLVRAGQGSSPTDSLLISIGLASLGIRLLPDEIGHEKTNLYLMAGRTGYSVLSGDYANAEALFTELLNKYGDAPNVHYMRGVYLLARNPDEAIGEFRRDLALSPSHNPAAAMLAWALLTRGDSEEALPFAERAVRDGNDTPFAKYLLGRALVETRQTRRGLAYLQQAENADANNMDVHVTLAVAYSRLGQPAEARRERETAMQQLGSENRPVAQP